MLDEGHLRHDDLIADMAPLAAAKGLPRRVACAVEVAARAGLSTAERRLRPAAEPRLISGRQHAFVEVGPRIVPRAELLVGDPQDRCEGGRPSQRHHHADEPPAGPVARSW